MEMDRSDLGTPKALSEVELRSFARNFSTLETSDLIVEGDDLFRLQNIYNSLVRSANSLNPSQTYRAAACNALCGFLEHGSNSSLEKLQIFCSRSEVWIVLVSVYLERSSDTKPKILRQILTSIVKFLTTTSAKFTDGNAICTAIVERSLALALQSIVSDDDSGAARAAMQLLETFLAKNLVSAHGLLSHELLCNSGPDGSPNQEKDLDGQRFVNELLGWVEHQDVSPAIGRLLRVFFVSWTAPNSDEEATDKPPLWAESLQRILKRQPELLPSISNQILPGLLSISPAESVRFVEIFHLRQCSPNGSIGDDVDLGLILATVRIMIEAYPDQLDSLTAQSMGELSSNFGKTDEDTPTKSEDFDICKFCLPLLTYYNPDVRLRALDLLLFKSDPRCRGEFISIMRHLFQRLDAVIHRMRKDNTAKGSPMSINKSLSNEDTQIAQNLVSHGRNVLVEHISLISWYFCYLSEELEPTASYQRHISALKLLQIMMGKNLFTYLESSPLQVLNRLLADLIMDPFEDVRSTAYVMLSSLIGETGMDGGPQAAQLMEKVSKQEFSNLPLPSQNLSQTAKRAEKMMIDNGRADYADGAGRLSSLYAGQVTLSIAIRNERPIVQALDRLSADITIARRDLRLAVATAPLHGRFIAIRYMVECPSLSTASLGQIISSISPNWTELKRRMIHGCEETWEVVKPVLCIDSPEGHVVEDGEQDDLDIGVKDTLSFAWRALKESSSLIHTLISTSGKNESLAPDPVELSSMGGLSFTQLAQLRHRGAFSTVAQTFAACCLYCARSRDQPVRDLLKDWYKRTLECIEEKASALTRRSAGLPAMMTGILVADPELLLDVAIHDLHGIALSPVVSSALAPENRLPQVHALNCMKDVFTNTRLGAFTEQYLSTTFDIALACLEHDTWAIRNCGLMLFKALLTRLVGGQAMTGKRVSRKRSTKLVYERHPNLAKSIVKLLAKAEQMVSAAEPGINQRQRQAKSIELVYPALEILGKIGIPESHHNEILKLLQDRLGHPLFSLREKTAATLASTFDLNVILNDLDELLKQPRLVHHSIHGQLLCLKGYVFNAMGSDRVTDIPHSLLDNLLILYPILVKANECPFTVAAYFDILTILIRYYSKKYNALHGNPPAPRGGSSVDGSFHDSLAYLITQVQDSWEEKKLGERIKASEDLMIASFMRLLLQLQISGHDLECLSSHEQAIGTSDYYALKLIDLARLNHPTLTLVVEDLAKAMETDDQSTQSYILGTVLGLYPYEFGRHYQTQMLSLQARAITHYRRYRRGGTMMMDEGIKQFLRDTNEKKYSEREYNMEFMNAAMVLQGHYLTIRDNQTHSGDDSAQHDWLTRIISASEDGSDFSLRLAAVTSLDGYRTCLQPPHETARTHASYLPVYLAIYNCLSDDDEEIRDHAASIASKILSIPYENNETSLGTPSPNEFRDLRLAPVPAAQRLLEFLKKDYATSTELCRYAITRLIGTTASGALRSNLGEAPLRLRSVRQYMDDARRPDTTLFATEKQNLYRSDVSELRAFASLLCNLDPEATTADDLTQLGAWTCDGLQELLRTSQGEVDGPLGWTSKGDVFVLGMRILAAADVCLHWERRRIHLVGTTSDAQKFGLQALLEGLRDIGKERELHVLWMRKIQGIFHSQLVYHT
ncbi:hypothetical protein MMC25_008097 [Agyrium rufum]|nr:hypothetical protein [Agyrium rufum]